MDGPTLAEELGIGDDLDVPERTVLQPVTRADRNGGSHDYNGSARRKLGDLQGGRVELSEVRVTFVADRRPNRDDHDVGRCQCARFIDEADSDRPE